MRWAGHGARTGERTGTYAWGNLRGKRPIGRPRRIWESTIKMYLKEIGWKGIEWIYLAQESYKWRVHGSVPSGSTKCLEFLDRLRNCWLFKD